MDTIMSPFHSAMMIFETAVYAVPAILGAGALASFAYGVISTGHYWIKEGAGLLKTGASIVGGAILGGVGGAIGGISAAGKLSSAGALTSKGEALKLVGKETAKGAVRGATGGRRGIVQTFNGAMWSEEIAGSFLKKGGMEKTIIRKDHGVTEIIEKPALDKRGLFEKRLTVGEIDTRMKAPTPPPSRKQEREDKESPIIIPSARESYIILSTPSDAPIEVVERGKREILRRSRR